MIGLWIEGNAIHYIDSSGAERSLIGTDNGLISNAISGSLWISGVNLHYIDASKHDRVVSGVATPV